MLTAHVCPIPPFRDKMYVPVFLKSWIALVMLAPGVVFAAPPASTQITFTHDVAPLLYKHCVGCHHPNDIAPMSLLTYKDARPWASAVKEAVLSRKMPPWQADSRYGHFTNDPRLTPRELAVIQQWVDQGAKEGDPADLPPTPKFETGWKIGQPDAVIPIPNDFVVKPNAPDEYVYLRAPTNFNEDRWVTAVELKPGNRRVVHHAHVYVYKDKKASSEDAKDDNASKDDKKASVEPFVKRDGLNHINPAMPVIDDGCNAPDDGNVPGGKRSENNILGSYLPGKEPDVFPLGLARKIPKGAILEFQIHYNANSISKEETDRTSVGLIFAKEPPAQPLRRLDISNYLFQIPAEDPDHKVTACYTFDRDVNLMSYTAHMHLRGKDMTFQAVHPDGRRETLLSVPNYDFNWQTEYRLQNHVPIERGTRIVITAHFDNSKNNRYNPDPAKTIRWGEPSREEMMDGWLEFVLPKPQATEVAQQR
jgi:Copper type II ascorbate-dependent monooxygenase, C-terminal domain